MTRQSPAHAAPNLDTTWAVGSGCLALILQIIIGAGLLVVYLLFPYKTPLVAKLMYLFSTVAGCAVLPVAMGSGRAHFAETYRLKHWNIDRKTLQECVFAALVYVGLANLWLVCVLGKDKTIAVHSPGQDMSFGRGGHAELVILTIFAAAFAEEVVFRGLFFGGTVARLGTRKAALVSSLLFYVVHLFQTRSLSGTTEFGSWDYGLMRVPVFLLGLMLCRSVERTQSLYPAWITHVCVNVCAFLLVPAVVRALSLTA